MGFVEVAPVVVATGAGVGVVVTATPPPPPPPDADCGMHVTLPGVTVTVTAPETVSEVTPFAQVAVAPASFARACPVGVLSTIEPPEGIMNTKLVALTLRVRVSKPLEVESRL